MLLLLILWVHYILRIFAIWKNRTNYLNTCKKFFQLVGSSVVCDHQLYDSMIVDPFDRSIFFFIVSALSFLLRSRAGAGYGHARESYVVLTSMISRFMREFIRQT